MGQKITVTESQLRDMVVNAINEQLGESENEGFFNNLRAGFGAGKNGKIDYHAGDNKDAVGQAMNNVGQRINNFKQGYGLQKQYTRMSQLKQELQQYVNNGLISQNQTIGQFINSNIGSNNKTAGEKMRHKQGSIGAGGAKIDLQKKAKNFGTTLKESVDKVVDDILKKYK
jgi:hypothetical protein